MSAGPPFDSFRLDGKVALVTGGSRGIGRAVAQAYAEAGADVVIASRKLDACERAAAEIAESTGRATLATAFHAGKWDDCDALADLVYERFGRCDVLVNNAGMSPLYPDLPSVSEELYDKTHAVNAKGPFRLCALIGTRMAEGDGGSIINVSSTGSWRPSDTELPYVMAKAGLNALTLAIAATWAPKVRANVVLPGPIDTDIAKAWSDEMRSMASRMIPMKRIGIAEDLVGVCLFLASDASAFVNGAQIPVDGGMSRGL